MGKTRPAAQKREPERIEGLLRGLRAGMSRRMAAIRVGLAPSTITMWFERQEQDEDLRVLCEQIRGAEAECQLVLLDMVQSTPQTSLALLGRKWPEEFGKSREEPQVQQQLSVDKMLVLVNGAKKDGEYDSLFDAAGVGSNGSNGQDDSAGGAGEGRTG